MSGRPPCARLRFGPSELPSHEPERRTEGWRYAAALAPLIGQLARRQAVLLGALLLTFAAGVLGLGLSRSYLGYGVETDFIGGYVPEAQRVLDGEPLLSEFHPPLYPLALAGLRQLGGDWLLAGVLLSVVSGIAVLIVSWLLFYDLSGAATAWGTVLTLMGSGVFLQFGASASTDLPFLALFVGSCLCASRALGSGSPWLWRVCGLLTGLAIGTRANGVSLILLILAPFAAPAPWRCRLEGALHVATGLAVPIVGLALYALATGSNVWPARSHLNLAMTYFAGGDRTNWEGMEEVAGRFRGFADVLRYDPATLARTYLYDLFGVLSRGLTKVVEPPLYFLFLPGLLFLIGRRIGPRLTVLLVIAAAQLLLVNFKAFQPRFCLFLVPLMGAAVGEMAGRLLRADWPPKRRQALLALFGLMLLTAAVLAPIQAQRSIHGEGAELAEVVPLVATKIPPGSTVIARKPHLAFYTGAGWIYLPDLAGLAELREFLRRQQFTQPAYLFYGREERHHRPQYLMLQSTATAPDELELVAQSPEPGNWGLYCYRCRDGGG
jgi:4-amino-4-deoxy-L-arabinose transferase-like glycosyltransferase